MTYNPTIKIGDVAEMLGYSDQYYFSKSFKMSEGISPQEYKKTKINSNNSNEE